MNNKLNLYDYLRAGSIRRWHIVNHHGQQSIAEHSFLVTIIATQLYNDMVGIEEGNDKELLKVVFGALFHDMPEVRTGDSPTPAKRLLREFAGKDIFTKIENQLMPETPYIGGKIPQSIHDFIAMADVIEAAHWITDHGIGAHAKIVTDRIRVRMEQHIAELTELTKVDWYEPVNKVLMALGMPVAYKETDTRTL